MTTRLLFMIATPLLAACATTTRRSASVVDYLYPKDRDVSVTPAVPVLSLPLKVGIAFVPGSEDSQRSVGAVAEAERQALLDAVAEHFRKQSFVKSIQVIPSAYLVPRGGFDNLDQIRTLVDVDVVALVSYDQMQFSSSARSSITYWTIVGAYLVEGEKNDTRTLLDAAVFDIASRKLLFRAPGVSTVKGASTLVDVAKELRRDADKGFRLAATDLVGNLGRELDGFKQRMRDEPGEVTVVERPEYKARRGGGATDPVLVVLAVTLAIAAVWRAGQGPRRR